MVGVKDMSKCSFCGKEIFRVMVEHCDLELCRNPECKAYGQWPPNSESIREYMETSIGLGTFLRTDTDKVL